MEEITGESLFQLHIQLFKLLNDGVSEWTNFYSNKYTDIFSISVSILSVLYGFASYNIFQLYQHKEVSLLKVIKFACFNIFHYSVVMLINLYSASCIMLVSLIYSVEYEIVDSPNGKTTEKFTKLRNDTFCLVLLAYLITFITNVITISFVVFKDEKPSCCFVMRHFLIFVRKLFGELMLNANGFVNPYNVIYRENVRHVTVKKLLQIRKDCALTLICFSIVMAVCCTTEILHLLDSQNIEKHSFSLRTGFLLSGKKERFRIFFFFCSALQLMGLVVGLVEWCSLTARKFIVHHAYIIEDDNEVEMENGINFDGVVEELGTVIFG